VCVFILTSLFFCKELEERELAAKKRKIDNDAEKRKREAEINRIREETLERMRQEEIKEAERIAKANAERSKSYKQTIQTNHMKIHSFEIVLFI
jgi:crotonobetainyl-CoA:carnitine CoA-transferase CaiB-like acyl-CoA transferase